MSRRPNRWVGSWALLMALALVLGGIYVRANLAPLPGIYWLAPYPSDTSLEELQRKAESAPAYQQALRTANAARVTLVLRALAIWLVAGATLYVVGSGVARRRSPRVPQA